MRHFTTHPYLCALLLLFSVAPHVMFAQSKGNTIVEPGWGSAWLEPANDKERKWQESLRKINAARQAHDERAELKLCDELVASMPTSAGPYMVRAVTFGRMKQFDRSLKDLDQAQKCAQTAKRPDVNSNILTTRATVHKFQKDDGAAASDLEAAIDLNGANEEALNNLAWLRATAHDAAYRNGRESVRLAQKAVALSKGNTCAVLDTLAAGYAEANDYPRAIENEKRAIITVAKEIKDAAKARKFQEEASQRLHLFEQHQPYHAESA